MIYFYLMKALPLLALLKIITTSCNLRQKTPNQLTSETNQRVIQDKLCILCMDLLKSSSTPPRRIDWEEKLAHTHFYIQTVCKSKDHPPPRPPLPHSQLHIARKWDQELLHFCKKTFMWYFLLVEIFEKGRKQLELNKTKSLKSY